MKFLQNRWKTKAIKRRFENRKLQKRLKELTKSRNIWKEKATKRKEIIRELEKEFKKKIKIVSIDPLESKPKKYSYSFQTIIPLLRKKLETSISFRALSKSFLIDTLYSNVKNKVPSHSTIINWIHKIGYYQLTKAKKIANDWIIILDHSIQFGQEKVFVIFGIRESEIDFSRPLQYHDLVPLRIEARKKWNGKTIAPYLDKLQKEIGVIKYAVGDHGSDIKKGLELMNIKHVHDITHVIALILEQIYSKDEEYLELTKSMSRMRSKFKQTNIAHIIPPNQRSKSRYHNTKIISDWGSKALKLLDKLSTCAKTETERGLPMKIFVLMTTWMAVLPGMLLLVCTRCPGRLIPPRRSWICPMCKVRYRFMRSLKTPRLRALLLYRRCTSAR